MGVCSAVREMAVLIDVAFGGDDPRLRSAAQAVASMPDWPTWHGLLPRSRRLPPPDGRACRDPRGSAEMRKPVVELAGRLPHGPRLGHHRAQEEWG
jgi:hypothetical protein